jgi:predicted amidohydrolase
MRKLLLTNEAVGQFCAGASMLHNLSQCKLLIKKASIAGAKVNCRFITIIYFTILCQALFLPEASDYIASSPTETISLVRSVEDSIFVRGIQEECKTLGLAVNVGIHEPTVSGQKVKNTSIWIDKKGIITQRYQKIHLFDVDIKGGPVLKESNSVEKGMSILPPFETDIGCVGLTICFDVSHSFCYHIFYHFRAA